MYPDLQETLLTVSDMYESFLHSVHPSVYFFETEHLNTLDPKSEMILSFMSTLAQEESHTKSEIMNSSIEMRFRREYSLHLLCSDMTKTKMEIL